jgi:hypothetical protein
VAKFIFGVATLTKKVPETSYELEERAAGRRQQQ